MSSKMKEQLTDTHYEVDIRAEKDNDGEILVGVSAIFPVCLTA